MEINTTVENKQLSETNTPILPQTYYIGQSIDIDMSLSPDSLKRPLFDFSSAEMQPFEFLGKSYIVPNNVVAFENTSVIYSQEVCKTKEDLQEKLSIEAGVSASYYGFSGEVKANYSKITDNSNDYFYCYSDYSSKLATLQINDREKYLTNDFLKRIQQLPDNVSKNNLSIFSKFFNDFGIYYVNKIVLGGKLNFYVGVNKNSNLSNTDISLTLESQFKGVFFNGKADAKIEKTEQWKSYKENSKYNIRALGGNAAKIKDLINVNAFDPSENTKASCTDWFETVNTDPAVIDFSLEGIWMLCGNKSEIVKDAWNLYRKFIRPHMTIETKYHKIRNKSDIMEFEPPLLIFQGKQIKPKEPPLSDSGFLAVVLNGQKVNETDGILLNKYYNIMPDENMRWVKTYTTMYKQMNDEIFLNPHLAKPENILLITSFGLDRNMTPTNDVYGNLLTSGAGKNLKYWLSHCEPGSMSSGSWTNYPIIYSVIGYFEDSYNPSDTYFSSSMNNKPQGKRFTNIVFYDQSSNNDNPRYTFSISNEDGDTKNNIHTNINLH